MSLRGGWLVLLSRSWGVVFSFVPLQVPVKDSLLPVRGESYFCQSQPHCHQFRIRPRPKRVWHQGVQVITEGMSNRSQRSNRVSNKENQTRARSKNVIPLTLLQSTIEESYALWSGEERRVSRDTKEGSSTKTKAVLKWCAQAILLSRLSSIRQKGQPFL